MTGKRASGFTLIEMMIVVAIIGILASIAYPSYVNQMRQSRRADCEGVLMQLASAMERDFSRNNKYRDIVTLGNFSDQCPVDGGTKTYGVAVQAVTDTTYTLEAVPTGPQLSDACGTLTLTNQLKKGSGGAVADCWK